MVLRIPVLEAIRSAVSIRFPELLLADSPIDPFRFIPVLAFLLLRISPVEFSPEGGVFPVFGFEESSPVKLIFLSPHVEEFRNIVLVFQDNELLVELPVVPISIGPVGVVFVTKRKPVELLPVETFPVFDIKVIIEVLLVLLRPFIEIIRNFRSSIRIYISLLLESPSDPVIFRPRLKALTLKTFPVELLPGETLPILRIEFQEPVLLSTFIPVLETFRNSITVLVPELLLSISPRKPLFIRPVFAIIVKIIPVKSFP